jgi:hypothetical protein
MATIPSLRAKDILFEFQSVATSGGSTTLTWDSPVETIFTGTLNHTLVLPNATTCFLGQEFEVDNASTGIITIQTNGGATLWIVAPGCDFYMKCTSIATSAGTWEGDYSSVKAASGKAVTFNNSTTITAVDNSSLNFGSGGMQTNNGRAYQAIKIGLNLY